MHAEPVRTGALLVLQYDGGGDAAGNKVPGDGNHTSAGASKLAEGILVEIKVVAFTFGTLVDDHGGDLVTGWTGDRHASTTVISVGPARAGESGAEE